MYAKLLTLLLPFGFIRALYHVTEETFCFDVEFHDGPGHEPVHLQSVSWRSGDALTFLGTHCTSLKSMCLDGVNWFINSNAAALVDLIVKNNHQLEIIEFSQSTIYLIYLTTIFSEKTPKSARVSITNLIQI